VKQIGGIDFSAGGHLASTAAAHFENGNSQADDPIGRVSCRPGFSVLAYPAISLTTQYTHKGSRRNLLDNSPAPKLVESLSNELQVTKETPPTFLMHTSADTGVPEISFSRAPMGSESECNVECAPRWIAAKR